MNGPTGRDLEALVAEARSRHGEREAMAAAQLDPMGPRWAQTVASLAHALWAAWATTTAPERLRSLYLHIALFALRAAWEAGRRMVLRDPSVRMCSWPTCEQPAAWLSTFTLSAGRGELETKERCDEHRRLSNLYWTYNASASLVDAANAVRPPRDQAPDVDALLAEAERREGARQYERHEAHPLISEWTNGRLAICLARALRAERERADTWTRLATEKDVLAVNTRHHLRAVLAHGWPEGTTGPACVRAARAFLGGAEDAAPTASGVEPVRGECPKTAGEAAALLLQHVAGNYSFDAAMSSPLAPQLRELLEQSGKLSQWWLEVQRLETRKALAAQNQAEAEKAAAEAEVKRLVEALTNEAKERDYWRRAHTTDTRDLAAWRARAREAEATLAKLTAATPAKGRA